MRTAHKRAGADGTSPPATPTASRPRFGERRGRLVSYGVTLFFLVSLNFFLPQAMPGDPISLLEDPTAATYVRDDTTRAALAEY